MAVHLAVRWSVREHICVRSLERSAGSTASNHGQYEDACRSRMATSRRWPMRPAGATTWTPCCGADGAAASAGFGGALSRVGAAGPELKRATLLRRPGTHQRLRNPPRHRSTHDPQVHPGAQTRAHRRPAGAQHESELAIPRLPRRGPTRSRWQTSNDRTPSRQRRRRALQPRVCSIAVVITSLEDLHLFVVCPVDQPVLVVNAAGPVA
jgi:hypothetical protein